MNLFPQSINDNDGPGKRQAFNVWFNHALYSSQAYAESTSQTYAESVNPPEFVKREIWQKPWKDALVEGVPPADSTNVIRLPSGIDVVIGYRHEPIKANEDNQS